MVDIFLVSGYTEDCHPAGNEFFRVFLSLFSEFFPLTRAMAKKEKRRPVSPDGLFGNEDI